MLRYVEANVDFTDDFLRRYVPRIRAIRPEASFLVWLDCRELGLAHDALVDLFVARAGLALNDGEMFGPGGEGHMRLNVGLPRIRLAEALERLRAAGDAEARSGRRPDLHCGRRRFAPSRSALPLPYPAAAILRRVGLESRCIYITFVPQNVLHPIRTDGSVAQLDRATAF